MDDTIVIERAKIYDEVWTEPVDKVAKRYGISNVMLAKICRKLNVPVPPRGHWARVAAGQKVARARLPKPRPGEPTEHVIAQAPSLHPVAPIAPEVQEKIALERQDEHRLVVADALTDPHPLIEKSMATLRMSSEARANARLKRPVLAVNVTRAQLDRANRIMDAVLKALDARGHRCVVSRPEDDLPDRPYGDDEKKSRTGARIGDHFVQFALYEEMDRVVEPPDYPKPARFKDRHDEIIWELRRPSATVRHEPTGRLALRIANAPTGSLRRLVFRDGKTKRLEDVLNDFVAAVLECAEKLRLAKEARAQREREWQERERRHREAQERRELEKKLLADLDSRMEDVQQASAIRAFVALVEARRGEIALPAHVGEHEIDRWITWAKARADWLEAQTVATLLQLRTETPTPWSWGG